MIVPSVMFEVPLATHPHQYLVLPFFLILIIPADVLVFCYGFSFISLITNYLEHVFMNLLANLYITIYQVSCSFKEKSIILLLLNCKCVENKFLYILDIRPLSDTCIRKFSSSLYLIFHFLSSDFWQVKKLKIFLKFIYYFCLLGLLIYSSLETVIYLVEIFSYLVLQNFYSFILHLGIWSIYN